jgi:hypothetical protein
MGSGAYDGAQISGAVFAAIAKSKLNFRGCSMQEQMFDAPTASLINGMRLKLERKIDLQKPCFRNMAIVHAGKGPHAAELRCAKCGSHRGWLPKEAVTWLQIFRKQRTTFMFSETVNLIPTLPRGRK